MSAEYLNEPINSGVFNELKYQIDQLYELPGALVRSRIGSTYGWAAVSAGKPWFDYADPPDELFRVRAIERWRVDEETRELKAGVMKIVMQQAFSFEYQRAKALSLNDHNLDTSDSLELLVSQKDKTLVMDETVPSLTTDVSLYKRFKVCRFASGTSKSTPVHLYDTSDVVVGTDKKRDYDGTLERFFYQEPLFELYNSHLDPNTEIQKIISELGQFIKTEISLAEQRG